MPFTECTVRGFIHVLCHSLRSESNGTDCALVPTGFEPANGGLKTHWLKPLADGTVFLVVIPFIL